MRIYLLISIVLLSISSCQVENISDKQIILNLASKYKELGDSVISNFKLTRTVKIKDDSIGIKLFENEKNRTGNKIFIVNNYKNEKYAIPYFNNFHRKYFNYENEKPTYIDKNFNSLFEKEFINAINTLNLNDSLGEGYDIIFEIFHSLLHFQIITRYDRENSEFSEKTLMPCNFRDNDEEFERRILKNKEDLFQGISIGSFHIGENNLSYDRHNHRVFKIPAFRSKKSKIDKLNIMIYRFGFCIGNYY